MSQDHTSDTIDGVFMDNDNASYDATAKGFIARKVFLARILKRCVKEFRKCSLEDIAGKYIVHEYVKNIKITFTFLHNMMYN